MTGAKTGQEFGQNGVLDSLCLVGTPEEIIEQIRQLEASGLKQLMLIPSLETQYGVIEEFARKVMAKL